MGSVDLPKSPMVFHPEKRSAVGSRNSLAQENRDQQLEADRVLEEEIDKVMNHISSKLPKEVLSRMDVMGGLKEKLYNYYNQNYQNMFNRYITTAEDEMIKKVRNFIDREEMKVLTRYTPKEIANLLDEIGGMDKFNTGEIEKSIVNMYGHLQGHIQRGVNDLENVTNSLLRQKTDVGAFIRGENAYSVVKCAFKDSSLKPKTVCDVKLSVNILDSELISPIFHYQVTVEYIVKELISKHIMDSIDKEIEHIKEALMDEGKEEMSDGEIIFKKMGSVENFTGDDKDNPKSNRYKILAKYLMERVENIRAEIDPSEFDQLNIRENLKKIIDLENIRNRGYNTAVNSITSILDTSKMGYQYIENLKNARELVIREYEDTDKDRLPDERYCIMLKYFDNAQLIAERESYSAQIMAFENEVLHLWDVLDMVYDKKKNIFTKNDFVDLAKAYRTRIEKKIKSKTNDAPYDTIEKVWDEISFIKPTETEIESMNRTYLYEKDKIKKRLIIMKERMSEMYGFRYPKERRFMEERLKKLEKDFFGFDYLINPYHIQPGILLDVDITSIKKKKATLDGMANVLNEFLHGVSKGFQDAAFASFSRRRSTMREDIGQAFSTEAPEAPTGGAEGYLQLLNEVPTATEAAAETVSKPSRKPRGRGVVDSGKKSSAKKKASGGKKRSGLRSI